MWNTRINIGKAMLMVNVQLHDTTCLSVLLKFLTLRFRMNSFNLLYVPEMLSCHVFLYSDNTTFILIYVTVLCNYRWMFDSDILQCTVFNCCLTTRRSDDVQEEQVYVLSCKITFFSLYLLSRFFTLQLTNPTFSERLWWIINNLHYIVHCGHSIHDNMFNPANKVMQAVV